MQNLNPEHQKEDIAESVVDIARYPISDPSSDAYKDLVATAGELLEIDGCGRFSQFIQPEWQEQLPGETNILASEALFSKEEYTPYGALADISRSWIVSGEKSDDEQKKFYNLAFEQVQRNCELFKAGRSYRDIGKQGWQLPEPYLANLQPAIAMALAFVTSIH